jgi:hypothetical protein
MKYKPGQKVKVVNPICHRPHFPSPQCNKDGYHRDRRGNVVSPVGCSFVSEMRRMEGRVMTIRQEMTDKRYPRGYHDHYKMKENDFSWYFEWFEATEFLPEELFEI